MMVVATIEPVLRTNHMLGNRIRLRQTPQLKLICAVLFGARENKALLCCTAYRYGGWAICDVRTRRLWGGTTLSRRRRMYLKYPRWQEMEWTADQIEGGHEGRRV